MKFVFVFILFFPVLNLAQNEYEKWGKADFSYRLPEKSEERDYSINAGKAEDILLKGAADFYWIFISNVDGDNCPFYPTCSSFFLQSVKQTNIFQGFLMFADRFTRDSNVYKRAERYPLAENGKFFDPVNLYSLNEENLNYKPPLKSKKE